MTIIIIVEDVAKLINELHSLEATFKEGMKRTVSIHCTICNNRDA